MNGSRMVITVPKDLAASRRLDYDQASEDDLLEEQISYQEFQTLNTSGWIDEVNDCCDTLIDEYEDEKIASGPQLAQLALITKRFNMTHKGEVFAKIQRSVDHAQRCGTEVHFFF